MNRSLIHPLLASLIAGLALTSARAGEPKPIPRHQIVPLPQHQVAFHIDGIEITRWCFGPEYPRPFFYPFNGPSGVSLTRMGHPGAPNHDHHRSVWFAHHDVNGLDFWSDLTQTRVRQKMWLAYADGDEECVMATLLEWVDATNEVVMEQELVAALRSLPGQEHALEIQISLRPPNGGKTVALGKTNFGFLAVRVAKSLSDHFGGGILSSSEGGTGEQNLFGKQACWMDYSGPIAAGIGPHRTTVIEGITYFDHPGNPRYPAFWHVRQDGWMGASFGMQKPATISRDNPLVLRYLLHAHTGGYDPRKAARIHDAFAGRPGFQVLKSEQPHHQFDVRRAP